MNLLKKEDPADSLIGGGKKRVASPSVFGTSFTMHTHPEIFKERADRGAQDNLSSQKLHLGQSPRLETAGDRSGRRGPLISDC